MPTEYDRICAKACEWCAAGIPREQGLHLDLRIEFDPISPRARFKECRRPSRDAVIERQAAEIAAAERHSDELFKEIEDHAFLVAFVRKVTRHVMGSVLDPDALLADVRALATVTIADSPALDKLRVKSAEIEELRDVCAEAYQLAGVIGAPLAALDNLSSAAHGTPLLHETFLPARAEDCTEIAALKAEILNAHVAATKAYLSSPAMKTFANLKTSKAGTVLAMLQDGAISRGKACEVLALLAHGVGWDDIPLPEEKGRQFSEDEVPANVCAAQRNLLLKIRSVAGVAAVSPTGNLADAARCRRDALVEICTLIAGVKP